MLVAGQASAPTAIAWSSGAIATLLNAHLPPALLAERIAVPSPFRRLDLTHVDILALGECFVRRFPDRTQGILLVGLRTSGSYFAPLLRAFLRAEGYQQVSFLTLAPNKGPGRWEGRELKRCAEQGYTALIVDDPPHTAGTIFDAFNVVARAGFGRQKLKALIPSHPAKRRWFKPLPDDVVVSLAPEHWHKRALLDSKEVETRLAEYFHDRNYANTRVIASSRAEELNARLESASSDERGARLKRIFEVHLVHHDGRAETRFVLAKSVGWGWLGYHAFLAGHRLPEFVPSILGLRDGILYMEWIPQPAFDADGRGQRKELIDTAASYVAARVRRLGLAAASVAGMDLQRHHNGIQLLEKALSRAYGPLLTNTLMRPRIGRWLRRQACPCPTLIDGNMQRAEWILAPDGARKTDYEHHGMGKAALNVFDPAYDLADTILNLALSPQEEEKLILQYKKHSGDVGLEQRLFTYKLLAGLWAMEQAQEQLLGKPGLAETRLGSHRRFMRAWDFLTVQTARYCGSHCLPRGELRWRSPIVILDVDGVLDRRIFGFPSTTAAGMDALSIMRAHGLSIAVNTARSIAEVKEYCHAYALAGGVAEHGAYVWDAVNQRGRALISAEAARQLDELKRNLQRMPGVFLDDRHQYSIRAFTYQNKPDGQLSALVKSMRFSSIGDGALAPLSPLVVRHLLVDLGLDRLGIHQTMIDTTVVAKEVDKGTGLAALRDWVLGADAETIAVGDDEPDLAMFRVATRSFAPANIGCARKARLLGCQIADFPHQRGLREIALAIVHSDGGRCERCPEGEAKFSAGQDLFLQLLRAADRNRTTNLIAALCDPRAFGIFVR